MGDQTKILEIYLHRSLHEKFRPKVSLPCSQKPGIRLYRELNSVLHNLFFHHPF